jgi:hypothetical protein
LSVVDATVHGVANADELHPKIAEALKLVTGSFPEEFFRPVEPIRIPEPAYLSHFRRQAVEKAEERRRQAEIDQREAKLAELAFANEERERRRERRERCLFWIAVAGLIFSIVAAVTGTLAIT